MSKLDVLLQGRMNESYTIIFLMSFNQEDDYGMGFYQGNHQVNHCSSVAITIATAQPSSHLVYDCGT